MCQYYSELLLGRGLCAGRGDFQNLDVQSERRVARNLADPDLIEPGPSRRAVHWAQSVAGAAARVAAGGHGSMPVGRAPHPMSGVTFTVRLPPSRMPATPSQSAGGGLGPLMPVNSPPAGPSEEPAGGAGRAGIGSTQRTWQTGAALSVEVASSAHLRRRRWPSPAPPPAPASASPPRRRRRPCAAATGGGARGELRR